MFYYATRLISLIYLSFYPLAILSFSKKMEKKIFLILFIQILLSQHLIGFKYKFSQRKFIIEDNILRNIRLEHESAKRKHYELEKLRQEEKRREQEQMNEKRRKIMVQYLLPGAGPTNVLRDFYSRF
jgi:hypothetical protein